jgi:hypothetical protein
MIIILIADKEVTLSLKNGVQRYFSAEKYFLAEKFSIFDR